LLIDLVADLGDGVGIEQPKNSRPGLGVNVRTRAENVQHAVERNTQFGRDAAGGPQLGRLRLGLTSWSGRKSLPSQDVISFANIREC
jgi:hypothetical protein